MSSLPEVHPWRRILYGAFAALLIAAGFGLAVPAGAQAAPPQTATTAEVATAPQILEVWPDAGSTAGGTAFLLIGTDLDGTTSVTLGGLPATEVVVDGDYLTAVSPAHAVGAVDVVVTTPAGSDTAPGAFTYQAAPTIASVAPSNGSAAGGTLVTITGTGLEDAYDVQFGGVSGSDVLWTGDTLTAITPAHAAGLVPVTVTTPGGSVTKDAAFTYIASPGAPRNVTGVSGNGQATVSWLAPTSTGGAPISSYRVTAAPGGRTCATTGALTCVVTGLSNGTPYTFTATATNAIGTSPASVRSAPVTPATVPSLIQSPKVASYSGPGKATISWLPPASNGGSAITGYQVRLSAPNSPSVFGPWQVNAPTFRALSGLQLGALYRIQIVAVNAKGTGQVFTFTWRQPTTPSPVRAPRVAAVSGPGQTTVAWTAPASDGGSPVVGYRVRLSAPNSAILYGPWLANPPAFRALSGLAKGATYRVQILALNSQGASAITTFAFVQPNVPGPVRAPRVAGVPGSGQTTIAWSPPTSNGGAALTGYLVRLSAPNSAGVYGRWASTKDPIKAYSGLVLGANYRVQILAANSQGNSAVPVTFAFHQPTVPSAIPSAKIAGFPAPGLAMVAWVRPVSTGGAPITAYRIRVTGPNNGVYGPWIYTNASTTQRLLTGRVKGALYRVQLQAMNSQGPSPTGTLTFTQRS